MRFVQSLFVVPLAGLDDLIIEIFFVQCPLVIALVLPTGNIHEFIVVAQGFSVFGLVLFPEMSAAAFFAVKGIHTHQFTELEEISYATGFLQFGIEFIGGTGHTHILPEFFTQRTNFANRLLQACFLS